MPFNCQAQLFEDEFPLIRSCPALNEIRLAKEITDLTIEVKDGDVLHAHRVILAARIPSLRATLVGPFVDNMPLLRWPSMPRSIANTLVNYAYTGQLEVTQHDVMDIIMSARMLRLTALETFGAHFMANSVTLENLAVAWDFSRSLNIAALEEVCINRMKEYFDSFVESDLFVRLPADTVLTLLQSEDLAVYSEEQVFGAIARWVCPCGAVDGEKLRTYAPQMLKEVQWHRTTAQFREALLDINPIYQTSLECTRFMAAVEQWIGAADTRRRRCPYNQHNRREKIFVFGQGSNARRWSVLRFDSRLANEARVADMEKRTWASYSAVDGNIFVIGGNTAQQMCSTSVYEFLVGEEYWRKRASLALGRCDHAATVVKAYAAGEEEETAEKTLIGIFGGLKLQGYRCVPLDSCEVLDVSRDRWYRWPDLREKRSGPAAVSLPRDGRIFVLGGEADFSYSASVEFCRLGAKWRQAGTTDFWQPAAPMLTARCSLAAVHFRGRIIAAGGINGRCLTNVVELFSPPDASNPLGQWTELASMQQARSHFTLLISANTVFALGDHTTSSNTVETLTSPDGSTDFSSDLTSWVWSSRNAVESLASIEGAACIQL